MVLLFDCAKEFAERRFLKRGRETGDDEKMFERRYAEFEVNNQMITGRYAEKLRVVS